MSKEKKIEINFPNKNEKSEEKETNNSSSKDTENKEEKEKKQEDSSSQKETQEKSSENEKIDYRKKIEEMKDEEIEQLFKNAQNAELYLKTLQRVKADYDNYIKRVERDKENIYKYANQELLKKLINVLDILERAIKSSKEHEVDKSFLEGIELVKKEFLKVLEEFGVVPIESINKPFNPTYHEAISQITSKDHPDMTVIQEYEKGYMYHDRVLRASKVVVSRRPKEEKKEEKGENKENNSNNSKEKMNNDEK